MGKTIGIRNLFIDTVSKRDLLFFDRLGLEGVDAFLQSNADKASKNEIEYLLESGLAFEAKYDRHEPFGEECLESYLVSLQVFSLLCINKIESLLRDDKIIFTDFIKKHTELTGVDFNFGVSNLDAMEPFITLNRLNREKLKIEQKRLALTFDVAKSRLIAHHYNKDKSIEAVPIIPPHANTIHEFFIDSSVNIEAGRVITNVCDVVLNKLPMPSDTTSFREIIDFKQDNEVNRDLLALRRWMRKVGKENIPEHELNDEVDYLTNSFERHMKLHRMKTNVGAFEALLTISAEIVENVIKLNLSKAVKSLFILRHRKIALMEAEMRSPGIELAYLIKASHHFDHNV